MNGVPLEAVSNVIELKPDKRYLLVFRGLEGMKASQLAEISERLSAIGMVNVCLSMPEGSNLEVIEAPAEEEGAKRGD